MSTDDVHMHDDRDSTEAAGAGVAAAAAAAANAANALPASGLASVVLQAALRFFKAGRTEEARAALAGTNLSDYDIQVLINECGGSDSEAEKAESVAKPAFDGNL